MGLSLLEKKDAKNFSAETLALWLRKAELECLSLDIPEFNKKKLEANLGQIRSLTVKPFDEIKNELRQILFGCGVVLCLTPKLAKIGVSGASRWYGKSILIQVSDLNKKEDIFWFTLFHELGHVLKHLYNAKKKTFIDLEDEEKNEFEIEADNFAKNALIPDKLYNQFVTKDLSDTDIQVLAQKLGVHEGILVGIICKDGLFDFSNTSKFRRKIDFAPELA